MITRRSPLTGLTSLVAAPAIVRVASIMPVRAMAPGLNEASVLADIERLREMRYLPLPALKMEGATISFDFYDYRAIPRQWATIFADRPA